MFLKLVMGFSEMIRSLFFSAICYISATSDISDMNAIFHITDKIIIKADKYPAYLCENSLIGLIHYFNKKGSTFWQVLYPMVHYTVYAIKKHGYFYFKINWWFWYLWWFIVLIIAYRQVSFGFSTLVFLKEANSMVDFTWWIYIFFLLMERMT